ncbi:hypothetical protein PVAND_013099 [Polypedilum vanderplanki]|uniref:Uncharacterized protein n=1 Tax=Polypedilum vanderplanki TaxID=319348 RepID=A0A9J6CPL6_POLVA|nr:hypothetical protein PVAND_013099 [Polypedilum vanderplanki]
MRIFFVSSVILCIVLSTHSISLPTGLTTCKRSDADFNKCLSKAIENSLKTLRDGNKEFGIPVIDPFFIDYSESTTPDGNENFFLRSSLRNTIITGLTQIKVLRTATKFNKSFGLKLEGKIDRFSIIGDYTMNGKVLLLAINGEGKCNVTMNDVIVVADGRGKYFEKNQNTFVELHSLTIKLKPKHVSYNFENLFKNNKELSRTLNDFMNEQWELVTENLIPGYEENFGRLFMKIANKIFTNVPTNEIFRE